MQDPIKNSKEMGLITGFIIGVIYSFLSLFVFSLLNGTFSFSITTINELLFSGILGSISGIISVNVIKKK